MLELYHNINSVCAQKVRIALKEKGQEAKEHLLTLQGDQNDPAYLKLSSFANAFRPRFLKMPREQWLAEINKAPLKRRAEYKRSGTIEHGLD